LGETVRVTVPGPDPLAGETAIHEAALPVDHVHVVSVVTTMDAAPPAVPIDSVSGDTPNEQLWNANWFDGSLCPAPPGPEAATRAS
jgi:hypothetical protein